MKKLKARPTDYEYEDLPSNRAEVFFDVTKNQWRKLLFLGFVIFIAFLPFLAAIFFRDSYFLGISSSFNKGTISQEDAYKLYCVSNLIGSAVSWVTLYFAAFVLGGVIRIIRQLVWGEPVFLKDDLWIGAKQNFKFGAIVSTYFGIALVIDALMLLITNNTIVQKIPIAIFLAFFAPSLLMTYAQGTIYDGTFKRLFRNSILMFIKKAPHTLLFTLILLSPCFLKLIQSILVLKYILLVCVIIFIVVFLIMIFYLFCNYVFDIFINPTHYPEMIRKGMSKTKE